MTALRHLRKVRRQFPSAVDCSRCLCDTPPSEVICEDCAAEQAKEAVEEDRESREPSGMELDAQREFSRVHEDLRQGRVKDAVWRLERVLDQEAPSWRELV